MGVRSSLVVWWHRLRPAGASQLIADLPKDLGGRQICNLPWGTKHIPYPSIRSIVRVNLGALTGRARRWGTSNPGRWASFDPRRATKSVGFDLQLGGPVKPLITPDDPDAFETAVRGRVDPGVFAAGGGRSAII
jgi:hypothetical protein